MVLNLDSAGMLATSGTTAQPSRSQQSNHDRPGWFLRTASAFRRLFTEPPRRPISERYSLMIDLMFMPQAYQSRFGLSNSAANPQLRKSGFAALYSHYFSCSERQ
jgi:hypothetical protein